MRIMKVDNLGTCRKNQPAFKANIVDVDHMAVKAFLEIDKNFMCQLIDLVPQIKAVKYRDANVDLKFIGEIHKGKNDFSIVATMVDDKQKFGTALFDRGFWDKNKKMYRKFNEKLSLRDHILETIKKAVDDIKGVRLEDVEIKNLLKKFQ